MNTKSYQKASIENFNEIVKAFQDLTTEFEEFRKAHYAFKRQMERDLNHLQKELKQKNKTIAMLRNRLSRYEDSSKFRP